MDSAQARTPPPGRQIRTSKGQEEKRPCRHGEESHSGFSGGPRPPSDPGVRGLGSRAGRDEALGRRKFPNPPASFEFLKLFMNGTGV